MIFYKKGHRPMTVDKDQVEIVLEAGWSKTKPEEAEPEKEAPKVEDKVAESEKDDGADSKDEALDDKKPIAKPKKIRKKS